MGNHGLWETMGYGKPWAMENRGLWDIREFATNGFNHFVLSPTFIRWHQIHKSSKNHRTLFEMIFAHGEISDSLYN